MTADQLQERWTVDTELLAQILEQVSVIGSKRVLKKPLDVPRPKWMTSNARAGRVAAQIEGSQDQRAAELATGNPYRRAMALMAATTHRRGGVRRGGGPS